MKLFKRNILEMAKSWSQVAYRIHISPSSVPTGQNSKIIDRTFNAIFFFKFLVLRTEIHD